MDTGVSVALPDKRAGLASEPGFLLVSVLLFLAAAGASINWARSMPGGWPLAGGDTSSMPGMAVPDQSWLGAAAAFVGMWVVMMVVAGTMNLVVRPLWQAP